MSRKVLFITEGSVDELQLVKSICKDIGITQADRDFYSYRTDLHQFARLMLPENNDTVDETLDVLLVLKSHENDKEQREILSNQYTDIFIIFDFDPHTVYPSFDKICALASFLTNSSDMGRLFINYPMMQSFKHLCRLPDTDYEHRIVTISEMKHYKEIVGREGLPELIKAHEYNHFQLYEIACHNFCKRETLLGRHYSIEGISVYDSSEDIEVLHRQLATFSEQGLCGVLNTSSLIYLEYCPRKFIDEITRHREKFRI